MRTIAWFFLVSVTCMTLSAMALAADKGDSSLPASCAKAYLNILDKLEAEYGPLKIIKNKYNTVKNYYGLCGGFVTDLGGTAAQELIVAFSRQDTDGVGIDHSEILIYSWNGKNAVKAGEMRVLASGNGRSWPEFILHVLKGKAYMEERWHYLPTMDYGTNEITPGCSEAKFYRFSGTEMVECKRPSYIGAIEHIGSYDNITISNIAQLRKKLAKAARP